MAAPTKAVAAPAGTVAARFDPRHNSLNALRLLFASLVIVSHAAPATGRVGITISGATLGTWAVFCFFTISGYLITRSRLNGRPARDYYLARVLRIVPAFVVVLLVVAFVFAPLTQLIDPSADWRPMSSVTYVLRNLLLYPPPPFSQAGIEGTLQNIPVPNMWDQALWTLFFEAWCYVVVGVAVSILPRRALPTVTVVTFVLLTLYCVAGAFGAPVSPFSLIVVPMFIAFLGGMLVLFFGHRLRVNAVTIAIMVILLVGSILANLGSELAGLPLAYLLIVLGSALPLSKVGAEYDISYGVYIYALPVQQMIVLMGAARLPLVVNILLVFAGTVPLAFLSSWLIERPAMRLKRRRVAAPPAEATPA